MRDHAAAPNWRGIILAEHAELRAYAQRLTADLSDADMLAQPIQGVTMNHPAWLLSHLLAYAPVLEMILQGEPVEDPIAHRHGRGSTPMADPEHYLPRDELIAEFDDAYARAGHAFEQVSEHWLTTTTPIKRWVERFPTIAYLPGQFLVKHMATHLGQLSAWRRAMGRPAV